MASKTTEERVAAIDAKITRKKEEIEELEKTKQRLLHPVNYATVFKKIKSEGISADEVVEKLGLTM